LNPKRERGQKGPRGTLALSAGGRNKKTFFSSSLGYRKISGNLDRVWNVFFDQKDYEIDF